MSKPTVVCTILARGGGSTFHNKNLYPLLGKPVIQYALELLLQTDFITDIVVWTEDERIQQIAKKLGAHAIDRPLSMIHYYSGFHSLEEWYTYRHEKIKSLIGYNIDYDMGYNCNYILIKPETLNSMFKMLRDNSSWACRVQGVFPVEPGLCLRNEQTGMLFPFWNDGELPPEEHPPLFRMAGIGIGDPQLCSNADYRPCYYQLGADEGVDFQTEVDIPFAEYQLLRRNRQKER